MSHNSASKAMEDDRYEFVIETLRNKCLPILKSADLSGIYSDSIKCAPLKMECFL